MATKCPIARPLPKLNESRKIHFVISARDLPMKDRGCAGATIQDPYVKWSHKSSLSETFLAEGVTKHRNNEPNPDWYDTVFAFDWIQGTNQLWHFDILDHDTLSKDDAIGSVDVDVDNYVMQRNEELSVKLDKCQGTLLLKKCLPTRFRLSAKDLPKLDPNNGLSDPYVQCFWSFGENGQQTLFATTATIKNTENAVWEDVIQFDNYQEGTNQYWTFKVFDKDPLPRDDVIGEASVNIDNFLQLRNLSFHNLSKDEKNLAQLIVTPIV